MAILDEVYDTVEAECRKHVPDGFALERCDPVRPACFAFNLVFPRDAAFFGCEKVLKATVAFEGKEVSANPWKDLAKVRMIGAKICIIEQLRNMFIHMERASRFAPVMPDPEE